MQDPLEIRRAVLLWVGFACFTWSLAVCGPAAEAHEGRRLDEARGRVCMMSQQPFSAVSSVQAFRRTEDIFRDRLSMRAILGNVAGEPSVWVRAFRRESLEREQKLMMAMAVGQVASSIFSKLCLQVSQNPRVSSRCSALGVRTWRFRARTGN